jgi:internalin A
MSELALKLIAENKKTKSTFLDLGNCGLAELPEALAELVWLEGLNLGDGWFEWDGKRHKQTATQNTGEANNHLYDIALLSKLPQLQMIAANDTAVADLAPLANLVKLQSLYFDSTQVNDLTPLSGMSALQTLSLDSTQVKDLSPLSGLIALHSLFLYSTQVNDLLPLSGLLTLRILGLSATQVSGLTPLSGLSALQRLYLDSTQVSDLSPLSGLSALQRLYLDSTQVSDLSPLSGLSALQSLDLRSTQVSDLSPLSGLSALQSLHLNSTQVSDLSPLSGLSALQSLDLDSTQVSDLSPLSGLSALQSLDLDSTQVSDLSPLSGLSALQILDLDATQVSDLSPLAGLSALQSLWLRSTKVSDLSPLSGLGALQSLGLDSTQVSDLSPLRGMIERGSLVSVDTWGGIMVENCPLTIPPLEIAARGNEAILNYFRERDAGEIDHLFEAKMLILGDGGAGKTSLLRRLYQRDLLLPEEQETTKGIAIHRHDFPLPNGRDFRLNVWDFGGQEIYHATHQFFLTRRSLYVLLDDTRKNDKSVSDPGFKNWLDLIELFGGDSPVIIFQNEKGDRSKTIDLAGIRERYPHVIKSFSGNLDHASAADAIREGIDSLASRLQHIGEQLPAMWIKIRTDIEAIAQTQAHIRVQDYFEIYERHLPANRVKALHLARYLHDLGVFLHFQDDKLLSRTVILQNTWATEAVYRILDDNTIKANMGRFTDQECARLWADSQYADMHPELLALMQHFELCYLLPESCPTSWIAPQLLPATKPTGLRDWNRAGDLVLLYRYQIMPRGIISRLMVRLHRFVPNPELACVTCVLFQQSDTFLLAELSADGREIELRARGPERKALLSVLAADLEAINDGFQGLRNKVDKRIPCDCPQCIASKTPYLFEEKRLRKRVEDRQLKIECPDSYQDVGVLALLDGIRMENLPTWAVAQEPAEPVMPVTPAATGNTGSLREFNIFLASSSELRQDRDAFDLYFRQLNDRFIKFGIYLKITRWENFLDAMSDTRLQDEYNNAVRASDVFVSLFSTKTGKFTEEEFDAAFGQFKTSSRPYIFTYFKATEVNAANAPREDLQSLWAFQDKLKQLGHYPSSYDGIEHLKRDFRDQLDRLIEMAPPEPAKVAAAPPPAKVEAAPIAELTVSAPVEKGWWQKIVKGFQ